MTEGTPPEQMTDEEIAEEIAHNASQFRAGHVGLTGLPVVAFGDSHANQRRAELANELERRRSTNPTSKEPTTP